jgi:hypothetical protein
MLHEDDRYALALLLQNYSIKEVLEALASVASDEADELVDMQIADKAQELSYAAEELSNLAHSLSKG